MDNFINQIAQRFSGAEVIKANAEAEAIEMRKLKEQAEQTQNALAQYDLYLKEMRKLNLRNTESAKAVQTLIENAQAIQEAIQHALTAAKDSGEKDSAAEAIAGLTEKIAELEKTVAGQDGLLSNIKTALEETVHKENVKVYRNIQAAVTEEVNKQTETLAENYQRQKKRGKATLVLLILVLLTGLGNLALIVAQMLGVL